MENLEFTFHGNTRIKKSICVGVAASGNLEILMEPKETEGTHVSVTTKADGNKEIWSYILSNFFDEFPIQAEIDINDGGAAPGVVELRLKQAVKEVLE